LKARDEKELAARRENMAVKRPEPREYLGSSTKQRIA
jgi:hypothetical protein